MSAAADGVAGGACERARTTNSEAPAESASLTTSTSVSTKPLINGAKKATTTAGTGTATAMATTSNQAKLERHLQSNNNQHAAAETPTSPSPSATSSQPSQPLLAKPKVSADSEPCGPAASDNSSGASTSLASAKCSSKQDVDEVARLFEEKPEAFEKWLTERAPPEALSRLHEFIESRKPHKRPSVTSDLFQQWMASPVVQQVSVC